MARGSLDANNAKHATINEDEGVNMTEIKDNAAVIDNPIVTVLDATDLFANIDIDDNHEMENTDSNRYNDNFLVPGIHTKYNNSLRRAMRQEN